MREILFRGFHEDKNGKETIYIDGREIKGEWEYGVPVFSGLNNELAFMQQMYSYNCQVIPETVGQFTGLTDKNGKKIFEGDIVNFKTTAYYFTNCRIKYQNCYARYCAIDNEGYEYPMDKTFEYEIIGNIFSNPEILRGECE